MKDIAIVHFNTPELTTAAVLSIRKHTHGCRITIFDNSDRRPFPAMKGVRILNNTKGQLIDFEAMMERYPDKQPTCYYHASAKHIASVDYLFDILPDGFVLMDSDVLVKKDISEFFDASVPWAGSPEIPALVFQTKRLAPYALWINVPMCREHGIRFMSEGRIYKLSHHGAPYYDTAASFYEDCENAGLKGKELDYHEYVEHFGAGSYVKSYESSLEWLEDNRELYQTEMAGKTKKEALLVIIPHLMSEAQGCELKLAVSGWRQYYRGAMHLVIVGEGVSTLASDAFFTERDITLLDSERVPAKEGCYRSHLDYVSCFRKVRRLFPDSTRFVMVADDCFCIRPFGMKDLQRLFIVADSFTGNINSENGWLRDKARTRALLDRESLPHRDFTTHLPYLFEWDKWDAIVDKYGMDAQSYVIEDLYYNTYFSDSDAELLCHESDEVRCWMGNGRVPPEDVYRAINGRKIWVCCSVNGYSYIVEDILKKHYRMNLDG